MHILFPLLSALGNLFLGLVVFLRDRNKKTNLYFLVLALSITGWIISIFLYWQAKDPGLALWCSKFAYASTAFVPGFLLLFSHIFPDEKEQLSSVIAIFTISLIALVEILIFSNLVVAAVVLESWGYNLLPGQLYFVFTAYFLVFMSWAFITLIIKYLRGNSKNRKQIGYVFLGFFLGSLPPIITNLILPALGDTSYTNIGPSFSIILIAFLSYAITKHHLMDISVVISRTFAEILTIISLGAIYFSIVWFFSTYVATGLSLPLILAVLIYGVFVGHNYLKMRLFFQTSTDKAFLHGKYDYYKALSEASRRVGEKLSLATILGIMYQTFTDVVEISNPRVFLPEHFTNPEVPSKRYVIYDKQTFLPLLDGEAIDLNDKLVEHLVASRQPILDPHNPERELIVPCMLEDRLIAIFVLGRKLSEDAYTDEDIKLIEVLANQAAISLDHTRSYEKITADLAAAENQLSRSQRLASLGTLMAGVTHEIRNPLTVIRAETERLKDHPEFRDLVLRHVDRIAGIVQRMLSMAKEKPKEESEVNINEAIESAIQLVSLKNVKVIKAFQAVPLVKGVQGEIEEVFMNLMQNATEAMQGTGTLTLKTYVEEGRVIAEVTDTGKGIPEELREKIFDPFFSTRHEGTGLGLSIVYRIIREMGGDIKIVSEEGKWTTFKVTF